jgi:hypothetical protein
MRRCVVCKVEIPPQTEVCAQCQHAAKVRPDITGWEAVALVLLLTFGPFGWYLFWLGFSALRAGRAFLWAYLVPVELEGAEAVGYGLFMSGLGLFLMGSAVLFTVSGLMNLVRRRDERSD